MTPAPLRWALLIVCLAACAGRAPAPPASPAAAPSLSSVSGLWETPTADVPPDWTLRPSFAWNKPYRMYGAALGLLGRLEVHGQFTEVTTREGFEDAEDFGSFKDRSFGLKAVLVREHGLWPQVAVGLNDLTGTGLFSSRYVVLGRGLELHGIPARLTLGLGQGLLGGESFFVEPTENDGQTGNAVDFHTSSLWRRTRPFGGLAVNLTPRLSLVTEYTPLDHGKLFGFDDPGRVPVNAGLKYHLLDRVWLQAALLRGDTPALGMSADLPLKPQGLFPWRAEPDIEPKERLRWRAALADNSGLAGILVQELDAEGFGDIRCQAADSAIWVEARDEKHLSVMRALGRMGRRVLAVLPDNLRDRTLYLNLTRDDRIIHSLKVRAGLLDDYLNSRVDEKTFRMFAALDQDGREHLTEFAAAGMKGRSAQTRPDRFHFSVEPKVRSFLNNREGFLKNKIFIRTAASAKPWAGGLLTAEAETVLYNQYGDVAYQPKEDAPTRTDLVEFERLNGTRVTELAFDQIYPLDYGLWGRMAIGYFESAFAGIGSEIFRLFLNGRLGLGLETETVLKRDPDSAMGIRTDRAFSTLFLNLYAQLWPAEGVSLAVKGGRFLAGDPGARIELRRTRDHYTIGAWATFTDTSRFSAPENRGAVDKGVFISVPLSIFFGHEDAGHFRYSLTGFTRDQGQTVRQPRTLFPSNPDGTVARTRREMRELKR